MVLEAGELLGERYRILRLLGEGGMGAVYQAWDVRLNVSVAVKEMMAQPGLDAATLEGLREQFQREATVLARLDHPNLVRVMDFFQERGNAYLVMNFVEGENLAALIERQGALPESQVLRWAEQLLDALAYCHARGVLHRDIKPQNVIIRPDGQAVLVDFGLVKLWDPNDPRTRTVMRGIGTPEYAPPEQYDLQLGHTDPRSDIYSLGAMLYHALTGTAPPTATMRTAEPGVFERKWRTVTRISERTKQAIIKAMALPRAQRWPTAAAMGAALGVNVTAWEQLTQPPPATSEGRRTTGTRRIEESPSTPPPGPTPPTPIPAPTPPPQAARKRQLPRWVWGILLVLTAMVTLVLLFCRWSALRIALTLPTPTPTVRSLSPASPGTPTTEAQPSSVDVLPTPQPSTSTGMMGSMRGGTFIGMHSDSAPDETSPQVRLIAPENGAAYGVDDTLTLQWSWSRELNKENDEVFIVIVADAEGDVVLEREVELDEGTTYVFRPSDEGIEPGVYYWVVWVEGGTESGWGVLADSTPRRLLLRP